MDTKRTVYDITGTTNDLIYITMHHSWYDASFKNICNQRQNHIMSMLRIGLHVGRNEGLTDHKIPRCYDATRMYYAEKSNEKSNEYFTRKSYTLLLLVTFSKK